MVILEYYFNRKKISETEVPETAQIQTIGREQCTYLFSNDAQIAPVHLIFRFQKKKLEINPIVHAIYKRQAMPINKWIAIDYNIPILLSSSSYIIFRWTQDQESMINESLATAQRPAMQLRNAPQTTMQIDSIEPNKWEGKKIGTRYEVLKKLGQGAMGEIYEVYDNELMRKVALKILINQDINSSVGQRFLREAHSIVKLSHPNIIRVYDMREFQGKPFFTMDLIEGKNLAEIIKTEEILPRTAMSWIRDIAYALDSAHQAKIIHRDVKPSNIMLHHGIPILMDFGIACDMDTYATRLTMTGETLGTPTYMSPEQAMGQNENIGPWTDVYGLGAVLYETLTKQPPFVGTPMEIMQQVCNVDPIPMRRHNPDIHMDAIVITSKAMCKEQQYRYQSIREMGEDIQRYLNGEPIHATMPPILLRYRRIIKKYKWASIVASIILVFLMSIGIYYSINNYITHRKFLAEIQNDLQNITKKYEEVQKEDTLQGYTNITEDCSRILQQGAKPQDILPLKIEATKNIISKLIANENHDFIDVYISVLLQDMATLQSYPHLEKIELKNSEQKIIYSEHIEDYSKHIDNFIHKSKQDIEEQKQRTKIENIDKIREILISLPDTVDQANVNTYAFSLLLYQDYWEENQLYIEDLRERTNASIVCDQVDKFIKNIKEDKQLKVSNLTNEEECLLSLLPYTSTYLENQLFYVIEKQSESESVQAFCFYALGMIRAKDVVDKLLHFILERQYSPLIVQKAVQTIIHLPNGRVRILKEILNRRLTLSSLDGPWGIPILLTILEERIKENNIVANKDIEEIRTIILNNKKYAIHRLIRNFDISYNVAFREELCRLMTQIDSPNDICIQMIKILNESKYITELQLAAKNILDNKKYRQNPDAVKAVLQYLSPKKLQTLQTSTPEQNLDEESRLLQQYAIQLSAIIQDVDSIPQLMEIVQNQTPNISFAAKALIQMPVESNETIKTYFENSIKNQQTKNSEVDVLFHAILLSRQDTTYLNELFQYLDQPNTYYIDIVLESFQKLDNAVKIVMKHYKDKNISVKLYILKALSQKATPEVFHFFKTLFLSKSEPSTIKEYIIELLYLWPKQSLPILIEIIIDPKYFDEPVLIARAIDSLGKIGEPALNKLLPKFVHPYVIDSQKNLEKEIEIKNQYFKNFTNAFIAIGDIVRKPLKEYFNTLSEEQQSVVLEVIGNLCDAEDIVFCIEQLHHTSVRVQEASKNTLVVFGKSEFDDDVIQKLFERINIIENNKQHQNEFINILEVLGRLGDSRVFSNLLEYVSKPQYMHLIASALKSYGSDRIHEVIHLLIAEKKSIEIEVYDTLKKRNPKALDDELEKMKQESNVQEEIWTKLFKSLTLRGIHIYLQALTYDVAFPVLQNILEGKIEKDSLYQSIQIFIPATLLAYEKGKYNIVDYFIEVLSNPSLTTVHEATWYAMLAYPQPIYAKIITLGKTIKGQSSFVDQQVITYFHNNIHRMVPLLMRQIQKSPDEYEVFIKLIYQDFQKQQIDLETEKKVLESEKNRRVSAIRTIDKNIKTLNDNQEKFLLALFKTLSNANLETTNKILFLIHRTLSYILLDPKKTTWTSTMKNMRNELQKSYRKYGFKLRNKKEIELKSEEKNLLYLLKKIDPSNDLFYYPK